jgi:uncharacterized protein YjiS (DUF1127 family)
MKIFFRLLTADPAGHLVAGSTTAARDAAPSSSARRFEMATGVAIRVLESLQGWRDAARRRREGRAAERALRQLNPRTLRDIGLDAGEASPLVADPFSAAVATHWGTVQGRAGDRGRTAHRIER